MKVEKTIKKRRSYDAKFKSNVLQMHNNGRSIRSLSESFGINENLIYRWKSAIKKSSLESGNGTSKEIKGLRKQLREVEQERDILKKALGIFSRHP